MGTTIVPGAEMRLQRVSKCFRVRIRDLHSKPVGKIFNATFLGCFHHAI